MLLFPFVRYWLFVCGFFMALLALLHPASIVTFVLTLVCVTPAYLLFERGRIMLGVVVFFVGMVVSAIVSAVVVNGSGLF
jgi:hypothetical protein